MNRHPLQTVPDLSRNKCNRLKPNPRPAASGKMSLRDKQARILAFIQDCTAHHDLRILEEKEYPVQKPGTDRGIGLVEQRRAWPPPVPVSPVLDDAP